MDLLNHGADAEVACDRAARATRLQRPLARNLKSVLTTALAILDRYAALICALFFFILVKSQVQLQQVYEFNPDEGNNLIKSLLLDRGFGFGEIWSDQPPLFSYLLLVVFKTFGWDVVHGRLLVLAFAAALLFAIYDSLRLELGHIAASAGVILLVFSHEFIARSVSVMLGLPAISFAALGVWALVRWRHGAQQRWLVCSGLFFGCSLATKMFTAFVIPIGALYLIGCAWNQSPKTGWWRPSCVWAAASVLTALIALSPALLSDHREQLFQAHFAASRLAAQRLRYYGRVVVPEFLRQDLALFCLSAIGILYSGWRRRAAGLLFGCWLALATILLYYHYPVWTHHRQLLSVPASALAGLAIGGFINETRSCWWRVRGARWAVPAAILVLLGLAGGAVDYRRLFQPSHRSDDVRDRMVETELRRYAPYTRYMITSCPMYAFRVGLPTPPDLAITSYKRFATGLLTTEVILRDLAAYAPEQVLLTSRWSRSIRREIQPALRYDYQRVYRDPRNHSVELYVKRDLVEAYGRQPGQR
jgi:hypothetical protein